MTKIYYDETGWVCNRYPYNIPVTDQNRYIEVDDEEANKTHTCYLHYSWRVKNGQLVQEQYEEIPQSEAAQKEMNTLKQKLADMDYKTSKYVDGEYTDEEWQEIITERKQIRVRVRELETLLNI